MNVDTSKARRLEAKDDNYVSWLIKVALAIVRALIAKETTK